MTPAVQTPASQAVPAVQPTQPPSTAHTESTPHIVPGARLPCTTQRGLPVEHDWVAERHGPASQTAPSTQSMQVPVESHTRPWPQLVPAGAEPVASQRMPPSQRISPTAQAAVGVHVEPAMQPETHAPATQLCPVGQRTPTHSGSTHMPF
jgi:hypothetical protein